MCSKFEPVQPKEPGGRPQAHGSGVVELMPLFALYIALLKSKPVKYMSLSSARVLVLVIYQLQTTMGFCLLRQVQVSPRFPAKQ